MRLVCPNRWIYVDKWLHADRRPSIVYCLLSVMGRPVNIRRQSVSIVEWMRRNGHWQFYKATVMRGLDGTEIAHPGCTRCAHKRPRRDPAVNST